MLAQHRHIALPEHQDTPVANHIHIGLHGVEQGLLLHREKILPARFDRRFGPLHTLDGLEAAENRLRKRYGKIRRIGRPTLCSGGIGVGVGYGDACFGSGIDRRTPARQCLRCLLVGCPLAGAFGPYGGVAGIGRGQSFREAFGFACC